MTDFIGNDEKIGRKESCYIAFSGWSHKMITSGNILSIRSDII